MNEQEWMVSDDPQAMLKWVTGHAGHNTPPSDRKLRLFAVACCRVLPHIPETTGHEDAQKWWANGEAMADGTPTPFPVLQTSTWLLDSAKAAADLAGFHARHFGSSSILRDIVGNPWRPVRLPQPLCCAECDQPLTTNGYCPTCKFTPSMQDTYLKRAPWLTPCVVSIAEAAYAERATTRCGRCLGRRSRVPTGRVFDFYAGRRGKRVKCPDCGGAGAIDQGHLDPDRLAVLSDALLEAGCEDAEIIEHLRQRERCLACKGTGTVRVCHAFMYSCYEFGDTCACPSGRDEECDRCGGFGWVAKRGPCVRGCAVLDAILGKK